MQPRISLITVCRNAQNTIKTTLDSALCQDYESFEHIVIDGASSDETLQILRSYAPKYAAKNRPLVVQSQRDCGIYDAMNRGVALAKGEVIGFLNADDYFAHDKALSLVAWGFEKPSNPKIIYADICFVNARGVVVRTMSGAPRAGADFARGFHPAHPSFYAKRELFIELGGFDLGYAIAADFELMLRFMQKHRQNSLYIDEVLVKMRQGGVSNKNAKNILRANAECLAALRKNGVRFAILAVGLKLFSKIANINYKNIVGGGQS